MKIALIELGNSHDECLYSQVKYLQSDDSVMLTLFCNEVLSENLSHFNMVNTHFIKVGNGISQWKNLFRLAGKLTKEKYDKIILNTAQGSIIKKLITLSLFNRAEFIGTLHNTKKLKGSKGQKIISRKVKKYFLLNDFLVPKAHQNNDIQNLKFSSYYSIFFPKYSPNTIRKKENEIWICIPGHVENSRRDYLTLLEVLNSNKLNKNVRFLLLGNSSHKYGAGKLLRKKIQELGIEKNFMLWKGFISPSDFHTYVAQSDYLMPLIHSNHASGELYQNQISGCFNLAFAYKKPQIMEEYFNAYEDFRCNAIFYKKENLIETINSLTGSSKMELYKEEKWDFKYQKKKYLEFVFEQ